MRGTRVRRPLPLALCALLALLLPLLWGCELPQASSSKPAAGSSSATAEAERTRRMEAKAAEIERKAEEIRNMEGSDQEKIDAVNRLDQERRELEQMQDSGSSRP